MGLGKRIQILRKEKGDTQAALSVKLKVSIPQLVRYETKGVQPPADMLKRIADYFGVSIDFIVNGDIEEKAAGILQNSKLLSYFKAVESMSEEDRMVVFKLIEAFIIKRQIQELTS